MFDQTQLQNNNGGFVPQPTMGGYNYQGMPAAPKNNNVLTPEQIAKLQQKGTQFSLAMTEEEMLRGICTHRTADGTADSLTYDPVSGTATCTICGYRFRPIEPDVSADAIKEDVARIVDILQTIKLMYVDLPAEAAKEYFPIIPLIEKIPQLFEFAAKNMTKHEYNSWQYNNRNMGAINMLSNLQNMFGGGMMNAPVSPAPYGNGGYNPMQATAGYPGMQQPMNPFGYNGASMAPMGNPAAAYTAQTAGYQFVPNPQTAPVAPSVQAPTTAPVAPSAPAGTSETTTVTQTVTP